jgi:hypothetical protein
VSLFYKVSEKELVRLRNDIFKERGIPALIQNHFIRSPFSTAWYGKDGAGGYSYEFCRVSDDSRLDMILVYINKGDAWIQLHLNVFQLHPKVNSIGELKAVDGLQFHLPPNSKTLTRLAPKRGLIFAGLPQHKIRFFYSKASLERRLKQLGDLLENDLRNINSFVRRWMEENKPQNTDWKGFVVQRESTGSQRESTGSQRESTGSESTGSDSIDS